MTQTLGLLLAIGIITNIVFWRLRQSAKSNPVVIMQDPKMAVLRYAPALQLSCRFLMLGLLALVIMAVVRHHQNLAEIQQFLASLCFLLLTSILLLIEAKTRKVVITEDAIASFSTMGNRALKWSEVESIRFNKWMRILVIESSDGRRLKVNPSLSGLDYLQFLAQEKLDTARYARAFKDLESL